MVEVKFVTVGVGCYRQAKGENWNRTCGNGIELGALHKFKFSSFYLSIYQY